MQAAEGQKTAADLALAQAEQELAAATTLKSDNNLKATDEAAYNALEDDKKAEMDANLATAEA